MDYSFTQEGWRCPDCGTVYAPFVPACFKCPVPPITTPSTPRFPITPTTPSYPRYGTGDFPENPWPNITCHAGMPRGAVSVVGADGDVGVITNLG